MINPNPRKYKKCNRKRLRKTYENKSNTVLFGTYGIQSLEWGFLDPYQIEAIRRTITSFLKKKNKIWIRAYPDYPVTAKPKEVRMGRGKGNVSHWVCYVKPGRILIEVSSKEKNLIENTLSFARRKLPFESAVVHKWKYL